MSETIAPNVVFFGHHTAGARCLRRLAAARARVALVVVNRPYKGEDVWYESVAETAAELGLRHVEIENLTPEALFDAVRAAAPDFLFSVGFRKLIPADVLALAGTAAVNLHDSLLPRYRGFTPSTWAIINGETQTGVTMHLMAAGADTGDILSRMEVTIKPDDTGGSLNMKLAAASETLFALTYPALAAGTIRGTPQDERLATWFGRRGVHPEDDLIDWSWSARRVANLVRAVTRPYPGAFTHLGTRVARIWRGQVVEGLTGGWSHQPPGVIVTIVDGLIVTRCGEGLFGIEMMTVEGDDGRHPRVGDRFTSGIEGTP